MSKLMWKDVDVLRDIVLDHDRVEPCGSFDIRRRGRKAIVQ